MAAVTSVAGGQNGVSRQTVEALQTEFSKTRSPQLRARLVDLHQGLARSIAARFCHHPHDLEDRMQVALLGLLNAVDRFDPDRGVSFSTFAWATITGELKRFHRNTAWTVHVPRSLQERYLLVAASVDDLTDSLGRSPRIDELAAATGFRIEDVAEAVELNRARRVASLDAPGSDDGDTTGHLGASHAPAATGDWEGDLQDKLDVQDLLDRLPPRSREILRLRFVEEMSQSRIAGEMGLSQMHISRLLAQSLDVLREAGNEMHMEGTGS
jgi:RNA polymerase sigma-B factor